MASGAVAASRRLARASRIAASPSTACRSATVRGVAVFVVVVVFGTVWCGGGVVVVWRLTAAAFAPFRCGVSGRVGKRGRNVRECKRRPDAVRGKPQRAVLACDNRNAGALQGKKRIKPVGRDNNNGDGVRFVPVANIRDGVGDIQRDGVGDRVADAIRGRNVRRCVAAFAPCGMHSRRAAVNNGRNVRERDKVDRCKVSRAPRGRVVGIKRGRIERGRGVCGGGGVCHGVLWWWCGGVAPLNARELHR